MRDIIALMPRTPTKKSLPPKLVSKDWGVMLRAAADAAGVPWEQLCREARVSGPTAWRVQRGEGTVRAASDLRDALSRHGVSVRPPIDVAPTGDLAEWNEIGRRLVAFPEQFTLAVGAVRDLLSAAEKAEAAMASIRHPLPSALRDSGPGEPSRTGEPRAHSPRRGV
jgi:hypothetical protein